MELYEYNLLANFSPWLHGQSGHAAGPGRLVLCGALAYLLPSSHLVYPGFGHTWWCNAWPYP